jgi:hypothetical protein
MDANANPPTKPPVGWLKLQSFARAKLCLFHFSFIAA